MDRQLYAQVILPLPLEGNFTYFVPPAMADVLRAGMRVAVPFGKKRFYTGVVASVSGVKPTDVPDIKPVALLLDAARQEGLDSLVVTDEYSQFAMPGDMTAWWIPGDYDTQEYEYNRSPLSQIRAINEQNDKVGNVSQTSFSPTGVQTSLMLKGNDSLYMNIHEAALVDFPAMHLDLDDTTMTDRKSVV